MTKVRLTPEMLHNDRDGYLASAVHAAYHAARSHAKSRKHMRAGDMRRAKISRDAARASIWFVRFYLSRASRA